MKRIKFPDIILFENEDYILINKPPHLSTLDDRNDAVSVLSLARGYFPEVQVCHRLDKDTSGVLAIAKNPEAYRHLSLQFEDRKVGKLYHAVVNGIHDYKNMQVDKPIGSLARGGVTIDHRKGKESTTIFDTVKCYKMHSLIACQPKTGRTHQIRIHLASEGAPICGDERYGGNSLFLSEIKRRYNLKKFEEEQPLIKRFALHARELSFLGLDSKPIKAEAPYPKDFTVLLRQLELND